MSTIVYQNHFGGKYFILNQIVYRLHRDLDAIDIVLSVYDPRQLKRNKWFTKVKSSKLEQSAIENFILCKL